MNCQLMGIVNVTPDSFSDGNMFFEPEQAIAHALKLVEQGADILDIGGESRRPGAKEVTEKTERERIIPVIKGIREKCAVPISVDTIKAGVAQAALAAGANIINDISALKADDKMLKVLEEFPQARVVLMHMQGTPRTMQQSPFYDDVFLEVYGFLEERINYLKNNGIGNERIIIDPGIGFGKRLEDNLTLLRQLKDFHKLNAPVLVGTSRKSMINQIFPALPHERLSGTLATCAFCLEQGVQILRVHDVYEHKQFISVYQKIRKV